MKLVVAEKPSVMRDIAAVLGATQKNADGALCGNGYMVTSARGHLVRLKDPDEYDESYKKWELAALPIIPDFELVPIENAVDVLRTLTKLMNSPEIDEIIEATDNQQHKGFRPSRNNPYGEYRKCRKCRAFR